MKYFNKKSILFSLLLGLMVGTVVYGATYMIQNVENFIAGGEDLIPNENTNQEVSSLGGTYTETQDDIATSTTDFGEVNNLSVYGNYRQGDDPNIDADSWTRGYLFSDFTDATTTPISINNDLGQDIYVQRAAIEMLGLATSTTQFFLGTSTEDGLQGDHATQCAVSDPDDRLVALMDNVLVTDGSTLDATSTILWSETYPADDHGYGTAIEGVRVKPDERIILYASTTDSDCDGAEIIWASSLFDGKFFMEFGFWK